VANVTVGQTFAHWTVTRTVPSDYPTRAFVRCAQCGSETLLRVSDFRRGMQCAVCRRRGARQRVIASDGEAAE
jgi:hypothetical protein